MAKVKIYWEVQNLIIWAICKLILHPSWGTNKHCSWQHTARNDCPKCFFFLLLCLSLSVISTFPHMAACQMWREACQDLMILQMPFFMLDNHSILIDTNCQRLILIQELSVIQHWVINFSWWWGLFAVPNHLSHWEASEADQIALVNTRRNNQHDTSFQWKLSGSHYCLHSKQCLGFLCI